MTINYKAKYVVSNSQTVLKDKVIQIQEGKISSVIDEKDLDRDMLMICETIKSCLLKASNIGHPLQGVTKQIIQKEDSDNFFTNWKLAIDDKSPVDPK